MLGLDWIHKNWRFLQKRLIKEVTLEQLVKDKETPTSGRFYGTEDFYKKYSYLGACGFDGSRKLMLRPYLVSSMPENGIQAIYIDFKKYRFNEDGLIVGLKSTYEVPIYIIKE